MAGSPPNIGVLDRPHHVLLRGGSYIRQAQTTGVDMTRKALAIAILAATLALTGPSHAQAPPPAVNPPQPVDVLRTVPRGWKEPRHTAIVFRHGDISWLPQLAAEAGWPENTWDKLGRIILRESGGCPGRIGGSRVDKNCNIISWDGSHHRSDSGLTQLNGTHWKRSHKQYSGLICKRMKICTQAPLLDAVTNLKAAKLLYDVAGWSPWYVVLP